MTNRFRVNQTSLFSKVTMYSNGTTLWHTVDGHLHVGESAGVVDTKSTKDGWQAGYYVIIVILVYGMSIVLLIASHINRKHRKLLEDRQIDKYLKEFQVVKERSSRDSYRNMKKAIIAKLHRASGGGGDRSSSSSACAGLKSGGIYRCISKTVLPITTLAFPTAMSMANFECDEVHAIGQTTNSSRETLIREKSVTEACLCNLYVIEEFEGEQKSSRKVSQETVNLHASQGQSRGLYSKKAAGKTALEQLPGCTKEVTAEINIPHLARFASSNTSPVSTQDQYEVSVAVQESSEPEETNVDASSLDVSAFHGQVFRSPRNFKPVISNGAEHNRCFAKSPTSTSVKYHKYRSTRRLPLSTADNMGYSLSKQQKDSITTTPKPSQSLITGDRSPNLVQISTV